MDDATPPEQLILGPTPGCLIAYVTTAPGATSSPFWQLKEGQGAAWAGNRDSLA